jgi:hypothetical protein
VLANLVQKRTVADAQQLGSSLSVPARFPQSTTDRVNLGFVAMAAKRQVSRRLQTSSRCGLANVRLPRIGAGGALITAVPALEFGVIHKLTPQNVKFDDMAPGTSVASYSENVLLESIGIRGFK